VTLADLFDIVRDARALNDPRADVVLEQAGPAAAWYPVLVDPPRQLMLDGWMTYHGDPAHLDATIAIWSLLLGSPSTSRP
jgi:hypothetical protein